MKKRLDIILVERGIIDSREKAKAGIMAGLVYVNGVMVDKAGADVKDDAEIEFRGDPCPYVGRGGLKLEKAGDVFSLNLSGAVAMDIGASTGGFTDYMLQNGASKVYSVDVGYGQLDWKLRNDERVVNMEKTNIRYLDTGSVVEELDFISIDVSFISLSLVFPVASKLLKSGGLLVSLVKPQFEAGKEQVEKGGLIRKKEVHREVLLKVAQTGADNGLLPLDFDFSPITGAKGNIEFLMLFKKTGIEEIHLLSGDEWKKHFIETVDDLVDRAHELSQ